MPSSYATKLVERYVADSKGLAGLVSEVEAKATLRFVDDLHLRGIWAKLRYVNLLVGTGNAWRSNLLPFGTAVSDSGTPAVLHSSKTGLSMSGPANSALRTGFNPAKSGITIAGAFRGAYLLKPCTAGVVFGGGDVAGGSYTGNYLGFVSGGVGLSRVSGTTAQFDAVGLGLQSASAQATTVTSRWRYKQTSSAANSASVADAPTQGSLLLNHYNSNSYMSDARLGAAIEGHALSQSEVAQLSSGLDRFHFEVGRRDALTGVFLGDSITAGVGVSSQSNRFSTQVAAALGITEINKGVSGSCAQSGSANGAAVPAVLRHINDVVNVAPSFVFILIGANDVYRAPDYTAAGYKLALERMIDGMTAAGISTRSIFLGTVPYAADSWYATYPVGTRAKAIDYASAAVQVAVSRGVVLVDVYRDMLAAGGTALLPDGLHPNDAGAQVIAQSFIRAVETEMYS